MSSSPPFLVVTDPFLFKHITAFAHGIPWPLYEFWLEHKPAGEPVLAGFRASHPVVENLARPGTLPFLDLADQNCSSGESHTHSTKSRLANCILEDIPSFTRTSVLVDPWELAIRDFRDGDSTIMLEVLRCNHRRSDEPALRYLFSSYDVEKKRVACCAELLHWFIKEAPDLHIERRLLRHAAERGELVRYLHLRGRSDHCDARTFSRLFETGKMSVLVYLLDHDLVDVDAIAVRYMIRSRDPATRDFVQRFAPHFQAAFESVVERFIATGECARARACIEWINGRMIHMGFTISIDNAASLGFLDCVALLHERGLATATTDAMDGAAENGHWRVVQFLHDNRTEGCTPRTMDAAAAQRCFRYVMFLQENRTNSCSTRAMDEAAKLRHLGMVCFLHENTSAGCTTDAMDWAAERGFLQIVAFLHTHRSEGCTVAAMDKAATKVISMWWSICTRIEAKGALWTLFLGPSTVATLVYFAFFVSNTHTSSRPSSFTMCCCPRSWSNLSPSSSFHAAASSMDMDPGKVHFVRRSSA